MTTTTDDRAAKKAELPRIAVIGCGAAAKEFFLPVLNKYNNFRRSVILVDRSIQQARDVAREFEIQQSCTDYRSLPTDVDAAIITTPHKFHAEQSVFFLEQGKHVFVEKPLGMTTPQVDAIVAAAAATGAIAMVNNYRRLFPSYRRVHELLHRGELGTLRRISIFDGTQFAWESASSFYLRDPDTRGVFLDRGAHSIDVLCWWLGACPRVERARYDAFGGVEGLMDVQLALEQAAINIKFSRFHRLANHYTIEGDDATIQGRLFDFGRFQIKRDGTTKTIEAGKPLPHYEYAWQLVRNYVRSIQGVESPLFTADQIAPSIGVIDEAYQQVKRFDAPWYNKDPNIAGLSATSYH